MKIARNAVSDAQWRALEDDLVKVTRTDECVFSLTGPGRVACLQGLVTCDVTAAGENRHLFGALLTGKGMIVTTLRVSIVADRIIVTAPATATGSIAELFARSLPPRLCRFENVTDRAVGIGHYGPGAARLHLAGDVPVRPGEARAIDSGIVAGSVARGAAGIEMLLIRAPAAVVPGWRPLPVVSGDTVLEACRILAGIPSPGDEIDEKTLPQEVRMEELGAISYTKGCYLGQETVARVHFRGHANRRLVLLVLDGEPAEPPLEVRHEGKAVGRLTSACWSPELDGWVAQAVLRREVEDGAEVEAAGVKAVVRVDRWLREP